MFGQAQPFQSNQNFNFQKQQVQAQSKATRQYDEDLYRQCGFSFPSNNLFLVSLMKSVPKKANYQKEIYFGMVTFVLGVGDRNNRTYDFKQKIVQKFSLKDLMSLAFTLKQLAISNTSVLPYTKFTNSGSGSKSLYLQYKEQLSNNSSNNASSNVLLGAAHDNLKINIVLSKSDAYGIADIIERIYDNGIKLEIEHQIKSNFEKSDYTSNEEQLSFDLNSSGGVSDPVSNSPMPTGFPQSGNIPVSNETPMANQNVQMSQSAVQQIQSFGNQYMNLASNACRR